MANFTNNNNSSSTRQQRRRRGGVKKMVPNSAVSLGLVFVLVAVSFVAYSGNNNTTSLTSYLPKRSLLGVYQTADTVKRYNTDSIIKTAPHLPKFVPKLLVWDGKNFKVFGLQHRGTEYFETMKYTYRYIDTVPLLVNALLTNFPDRFVKDSPPFELLFSDADSSHSPCVNTKDCPVDDFSPILLFGSVPKDQSVFPTMRSFPNPSFARCLYEYQINGKDTQCEWTQKINSEVNWSDLQETIVWRGADWTFLNYDDRFKVDGPQKLMESMSAGKWKGSSKDEILNDLLSEPLVDNFGPRWRAGLLSTQAEGTADTVPWIDSRFVGGENVEIHQALARKGANVTGERMDSYQMSSYKYQIDFGGGGGTTWEGTLTKLLMPGVLFHHETANKDWFYDMIEPWKHYIPVEWDLSNLQSAYSVAQNNPDRAYAVSQEATKLANYLLSPDYMAQVYQELFVDYLGKLVHNYEPPEESGGGWEEMAKKYKKKGFNVFEIGVCQGKKCSLECRPGEKSDVLVINSDAPKRGAGAAALRGSQQDGYPPEQQQDNNGGYDSGYGGDSSGSQQYGNQNYDQQAAYGEDGQQNGGYQQGYGEQQQQAGGDYSGGNGYGAKQQYAQQQGDASSSGGYNGQGEGYDQQAGWDQQSGGYDQQQQQQGGYDQQSGGYDQQQQGGYGEQQGGGYAQQQEGGDQQGGWNQQQGGYDQQQGGYDQPRGGDDQQQGYGQDVSSESRRGRGRSLGYNGPSDGYGSSTINREGGDEASEAPQRGAPNDEQKKFLSSDQLSRVGGNRKP